jgi:hypothetical protein
MPLHCAYYSEGRYLYPVLVRQWDCNVTINALKIAKLHIIISFDRAETNKTRGVFCSFEADNSYHWFPVVFYSPFTINKIPNSDDAHHRFFSHVFTSSISQTLRTFIQNLLLFLPINHPPLIPLPLGKRRIMHICSRMLYHKK